MLTLRHNIQWLSWVMMARATRTTWKRARRRPKVSTRVTTYIRKFNNTGQILKLMSNAAPRSNKKQPPKTARKPGKRPWRPGRRRGG